MAKTLVIPKGMTVDNSTETTTALNNAPVGGGNFGGLMLAKGDSVKEIVEVVEVTTTIRGQKEPIKYPALKVVTERDEERLVSVSGLLRRFPGASAPHGIFQEAGFANCNTIGELVAALRVNPKFTIKNVIKNMEFQFGKASVMETSR